jgi:DNA-binding MarR family transcriptional regulator
MKFKTKPPAVAISEAGEGKRGEGGYLGYLLRQAANAQRRRIDRSLSAMGLTHPQFVVLTMVRAYQGCSNAELARVAMLTPQTVHAIIANLERRGLIARQPDPTHGRIRHTGLTAAGGELLERARERVLALESALEERVTARELAAIRRWLVDVARAGDAPLEPAS